MTLGEIPSIKVSVEALSPVAVPGDLHGDSDVDRNDMNVIKASLDRPGFSADNPLYISGDGSIT